MKNPVAVPPESDPNVRTRPSGVNAACTGTSGQLSISGESHAPLVRFAMAESDEMIELQASTTSARSVAIRRLDQRIDRKHSMSSVRLKPTPGCASTIFFLVASPLSRLSHAQAVEEIYHLK